MEDSNICLGDVKAEFPPDQLTHDEIVEERTETVVKQEIIYKDICNIPNENPAGLGNNIETLKKEAVGLYDTEEYWIKPTFEIQENEYKSESKCVMKVEQNVCDIGDEFADTKNGGKGADIPEDSRDSPLLCKGEQNYSKYENPQIELTDWRHASENEIIKGGKKTTLTLGLIDNTNSDLHKCHKCSFATKHAGHFKRHMLLIHRAKSEVDLYKCHECSYAAKRAGSLKMHMLIHKAKSEVDLYKCHECSYAARESGNLKKHMLIHKAKSEVDLYKCQECLYAAKRARQLRMHMLVHKAKSEVDLHECKKCSFTTKYAGYLIKHMLRHEDKSELDIHKC